MVTSVFPYAGPSLGGLPVRVQGNGFSTTLGATTIRFGATVATDVACASTTTCYATAPSGDGTVDVTVTVGGQTSTTNSGDWFRYLGP